MSVEAHVEAVPVIDPGHFRQVLGQFPTGVVVVTARDEAGEAIGMTVGSFTSVSLDPPLVAFLPDQGSSSWKALRESGTRFCVNVLDADQEDVCRKVAMRKIDKFSDIAWSTSPAGNPVIAGAVAWIDCDTEAIHEAGDHHIVIGRVQSLELGEGASPLLFFRGGYGSFTPHSLAARDADLLDQLRLVDLARPWMERLAADKSTEVTAIALVRGELVLAASAGHAEIAMDPTRVGQRIPFAAPLGSCFAAFSEDDVRRQWLATISDHLTPEQSERLVGVPDLVRQRGYAIALGHSESSSLERTSTLLHAGEASPEALREAIVRVADGYNRDQVDETVELRSLSAPVFDAAGNVAFTLTVWGPPGSVPAATVSEYADALLAATAAATSAIGGVAPLG
ncbi:flavin reductase [Nocardioides sp.]|uniref:flavin reductase n=1 Tax=Nocardioides sp. TaxID=35761 RepID=UPI002610FFC9|nr:flavin reductase [Nocardioides sp.]